MTRIFAALALFALATSAPLQAKQVDLATLLASVDALSARVAKLEGQITAADLVGTYAVNGFQTELSAGGSTHYSCCHVSNYVFNGTATLAADGTFSVTTTGEIGTQLQFPPFNWNYSVLINRAGGTFSGTWSYAGGALAFGVIGDTAVVAGGRLLVHSSANQSDGTQVILLLTRTN